VQAGGDWWAISSDPSSAEFVAVIILDDSSFLSFMMVMVSS
jgi:hypothetical protein